MTDENPYQSPNDVIEASPLTAEDAARFEVYDPLGGPAVICIIGSLVILMYAGLMIIAALVGIALGNASAWETLAIASAFFVTASPVQFAGYAMLNRRYRLVVIFTSVLGLFACVLAPLFAIILFRLCKPDVWNSFR